MNRDPSPEHDPALAAVVDALAGQATALDRAITRADLSSVTLPELRGLLGLVSEADDAIDKVLVAVDAANRAELTPSGLGSASHLPLKRRVKSPGFL